jgi:rhodanese-related sulfurtransferase
MGSFTEQSQDLAPERVKDLLGDDEIQLVDIREDYEHEAGRIEGDRHIVMDRLAAEVDSLEGDKPVVFYCRTGSRSAVAVQAFRASGRDAYHLDGGIVAWVDKGLPIEGEVAPH